MKARLATLTECETADGYRFMKGRLGDLNVRLHPAGATRDGWQRWHLTLVIAKARRAEGVVSLGGKD